MNDILPSTLPASEASTDTAPWICSAEGMAVFDTAHYFASGHLWGVLQLQGTDALQFLQGQSTTDTRRLSTEQGLSAATLNLKGRVLELFRLVALSPEQLLLILPMPLIPAFCLRMQRYLMFSKSRLENVTTEWILTIEGHTPDSHPRHHCTVHSAHHLQLLLSPHRSLHLSRQPLQAAENCLPGEFAVLSELRDGFCYLTPALSGLYLPQMLHLQALDGLSFEKGCYTGQEIVARTWFRGQIKQALHAYQGTHSQQCLAGMPLFVQLTHQDPLSVPAPRQAAGEILMAVSTGSNFWELLAVVRWETRDEPHYFAESSTYFSAKALPYAIPLRAH